MQEPRYILLPVSTAFIVLSLFSSFLLNFLPWGSWPGTPDFVALTLVFWSIHQPRKVNVGVAFMMGLLMDVHNASLLGEHALAYTLLSYFAITVHRRVLWFSLLKQALHVFPLFLVVQIIQTTIHFLIHHQLPNWLIFTQSVTTAVLWPIATLVLLAPQRRAVDHDETRPI